VLRSWRSWVLIVLLVGPFLVYIGLGFLWLLEHGWLVTTLASLAWVASGVVFYVLGERWTKSTRAIMPPIDWNAPHTFAPNDRQAWTIVQNEAERGESVELDKLTTADLYIETGRRLAAQLAKQYHPLADNPIEDVPVLELLTALELAAEDLTGLCRQVPGGDLITASHWKSAVQAAGYIQKANNIYSYLLPLFNPITGLPRLASQHLMVKPAWKNMQQNLLRWFYQAYVNRLGMHLIEMYSGRLVIGADQYRRLTRKIGANATETTEETPLTIEVAGARESGHHELVEEIRSIHHDDRKLDLARLKGAGISEGVLDRLLGANWIEVPGYTSKSDRESARDRSTRRHAVEEAVQADLLLLLIDDRHGTLAADAALAADWDRWYVEHPALERPPLVVAMLTSDLSRLDAARAVLPPTISEIVAIDPAGKSPIELARAILPSLAAELPRAERTSILRHFHKLSTRSKAGRLIRQVGTQGKRLLGHLRRPKPEPAEEAGKSR
jgi:hypothetical protein